MPAAVGPIFFAWVDPDETTFGPQHMRCDEQIVRFNRELAENSFAKVTIDIRNPREGPLAPGRKVWAWLAWDSGAGVKQLLFGQLVAVPTNLLNEVITFVLIARPRDWVDQRAALADSLRVLPYYDEIFVDAAYHDDPDVVLDGYSAAYHAHHTTHVVTISDFLVGEAGLITFDESMVVRSSVSISVDRAPLRAVTVNGEIPWAQALGATFNMGAKKFLTYTGGSLVSNWPKTGDSLAGGYYVASASAIDDLGIGSTEPVSWQVSYTNRKEKHADGDLMSFNESFSGPTRGLGGGPDGGFEVSEYGENVVGDPATGTPASFSRNRVALTVPRWQVSTTLVLGVDANRDRKENVSLTVTSDLQPVLEDPDDESTVETIDLPAADVAKECDTSGAVIGDPSRSEYISTDRGLQSIEYMIMRARAKLILGARVVKVKFECRFADAVDVTTRHDVRIIDPRLPGGEAVGKVISTSIRREGSPPGEYRGTIEIACAVGHGNAITTSAGTPDYVEEGALEPGIQTYTGQVIAAASGDVGYSPPILIHGGGGMESLTKSNLVIREQVLSSAPDVDVAAAMLAATQSFPPGAMINGFALLAKYHEGAVRAYVDVLANTQTWYELELKNLEGAGIEADWAVDIEPLVIPRQIDLEAGSTI